MTMPNIKFSYLYRDAGNYKNFGCIVFSNPANLPLATVEANIKRHLIDGCWFYAEEWQLPDLRFADTSYNDPTWHEFEGVEYTNEVPTLELSSLLSLWDCFVPRNDVV